MSACRYRLPTSRWPSWFRPSLASYLVGTRPLAPLASTLSSLCAPNNCMRIEPTENVRMAFGALWAHRFRSLLTIIGIVIGITTVVTVSSLLTGLRQGVVTFFQEFGPDNIFVARSEEHTSELQSQSNLVCRL